MMLIAARGNPTTYNRASGTESVPAQYKLGWPIDIFHLVNQSRDKLYNARLCSFPTYARPSNEV